MGPPSVPLFPFACLRYLPVPFRSASSFCVASVVSYQSIVTCHGLGAMNANTVVIPFVDPAAMTEANIRRSSPSRSTVQRAWMEHAVRLQRWPWSPPSSTPLPPIFDSLEEFVGVVQDTLSAHKNVLITRHFHKVCQELPCILLGGSPTHVSSVFLVLVVRARSGS